MPTPTEIKVNFDVNEYINELSSNSTNNEQLEHDSDITFDEVVEKVREKMAAFFDESSSEQGEKEKRFEIEQAATLGKEKESKMVMAEIEKILQDNGWFKAQYPTSCYDSLVEAVFHENYRFGILKKWDRYPDSPSAKIVGNKLKFKIGDFMQEQEETFRDGYVEQIIRDLTKRIDHITINPSNPSQEFDMYDGTRVKVMIPPKTNEPTIIFRRFHFQNFSFEHQAKKKTIHMKDRELFKAISRLHLNTLISGPVESGKSTMLKTIFAARDKKYSSVLIEDTKESHLQRDFPDRDIIEIYLAGTTEQIYQSISDAMRIDHHFLMFQEIRAIEADGAIHSMQKGTRGTLTTSHITFPEDAPEVLSNYIVDFYPNRSQEREIARISRYLDLGIMMNRLDDGTGRKIVTGVCEYIYDRQNKESYINYLIKYNEELDRWEYNPELSPGLLNRMYSFDSYYAEQVIEILKRRAKECPIQENNWIKIN